MNHKEIKYGTELHQKLRDAVWNRFMSSRQAFGDRHRAWAEAEDIYMAYVPATEEERKRKEAQKKGEMTFSQVVVPYSYATLLAAHTYWATVFLGRNPVFQFTARHGEGHQSVQAVEAVIDYQVQVGQMLVPLYLWLLDAGKYGIGIVGNYWDEEMRMVSSIEDVPAEYLGFEMPDRAKPQMVTRVVEGYVGNRIFNVRPQDWFPDPRVSLVNFQQGEYCARYVEVSWNHLLKSREDYFNLEILREKWDRLKEPSRVQGGISTRLPDRSEFRARSSDTLGLIEMVWELVPKEWGLGESLYPEKWVLTLAGGEVLIGCRPQGLVHGQFPYAILLYDCDSYGLRARGIPEILEPLERTLSWLFNSHFFNVRKALNDQFVVDPSRIVMRDLLEGGPGRIIRLNPSAYGTDVSRVLYQVPFFDVTRQHAESARLVLELIQRVSGVTDNIMGLVNVGGRKTATEVRTSTAFGANRLKTFCEFNSALGFAFLAQVLLQNTQQLLDKKLVVRIAGDLLQWDQRFLTVDPQDIAGFYDFVPVDGTLPVDRFAQSMLWKEILAGLAQMPQIAANYDIAGIFSWMAQLAGLKNISQFKVSPNEELARQVEAGNVIPAKEVFGGPTTNAAGGSPQSEIGPLSALGF